MNVRTVIKTDIDLTAIYGLCSPIDKKRCAAEIRSFVRFQLRMRASDESGWAYPDDEVIANHLVERGIAVSH